MNNVIVITHKDCFDGVASAWVLKQKYPNAKFIEQNYDEEPMLTTLAKDDPEALIIIADFSYPINVLIDAAWKQLGGAILVMDHHAPFIAQVEEYRRQEDRNEVVPIPSHVEFILDNDRSGAMIAWDYCNMDGKATTAVVAPSIVRAVQDHDLHRKQIPWTADTVMAIGFYGMDINAVETVSNMEVSELTKLGLILRRKQNLMVEWHIQNTTRYIVGALGTIPVTNAPRYVASDVINELAKGKLFGIAYYDTNAGLKLSFRSDEETGVDVSELAAVFGGSGHKHAAGAVVQGMTIDSVVFSCMSFLQSKNNGQ